MLETTVTAWHWLQENHKLGYEDGREIRVGETLSANGELILCENGMHASRSALDALKYAPGPILCRVEIWGDLIHGKDKIVGHHRKCLVMADATEMLRSYARWCALQVIDNWDAPAIVREYLETGDESLRETAYNAAWSAAWSASRDAQVQELEQRCLTLMEES